MEVADPYRWLEDGDRPEVREWVAAQNQHTRTALDALPDRDRWHERLVALMARPVASSVAVRDDLVFALERPHGAQQFVLTVRAVDEPDADPRVLVDPSTTADDATAAIDWYQPSPDGSLVAVGVSDAGTEHSRLSVIATGDGVPLSEDIPDTRAASVAWEPDGSGFFYTRYPPGDEYHRSVRWHAIGTDGDDDPVIWRDDDDPTAWPSVELSPDGGHLLVAVGRGWARTDALVLDRRTGAWTTVIARDDVIAELRFGITDGTLVGVTNLDAPRGRVVEVPIGTDDPDAWTTLVPEGAAVLNDVAVGPDELYVLSQRRAVDTIHRYDRHGQPLGVVTGLPDAVAIPEGGISVDRSSGLAVAVVDSFDAPTTLWRIAADGSASRLDPAGGGDTSDLVVDTLRYPSADGTEIGLFVLHRPDVSPGPDVPLVLNGYGGFAIAETPVWSPQVVAWCEAGGVYAIAGLRGGAEEGEAWHHAGRRDRKQNVFDDFHAAADWLVDTGRASRDRLAIVGRSNGGLLVGVAMTQRPDLCRAVWCGVPLLDMIRFPQFLIARLWTSEYGDPDVAEEFGWLHAYSPYHHVHEGTCYPATLFSTAEGDSRVDPLHARKMAALVQAATACGDERPILLFQEGRAGHGVGKPVHKRADELADGIGFLADQVGLAAPR